MLRSLHPLSGIEIVCEEWTVETRQVSSKEIEVTLRFPDGTGGVTVDRVQLPIEIRAVPEGSDSVAIVKCNVESVAKRNIAASQEVVALYARVHEAVRGDVAIISKSAAPFAPKVVSNIPGPFTASLSHADGSSSVTINFEFFSTEAGRFESVFEIEVTESTGTYRIPITVRAICTDD
jgi:hypothetical protein